MTRLTYVVYIWDGKDNFSQYARFDAPIDAARCAEALSADVDGDLDVNDEVQIHVEGWEPDYKGAAPGAL